MKMVIPMTDVVFIRDFSTDQKLVKEVRFTLEIETTEVYTQYSKTLMYIHTNLLLI